MAERRCRIHGLVLALITQRSDLELLDGDEARPHQNPASWIDQEAGGLEAPQRRV